ncbi:MAG TPA: prolyl oligopeptidase family serine peptidase [Gemmatimonadaceae bacterium]|nr:prolyl oligopeptidase family serine peptidase [Gemmatimonadaceae bacterium]
MALGAQNVVPNEHLVVDGIPPISARVAETVGRYTEFRSAALQDWHPTRREILIGTRFADVVQMHVVRFPGGDRRQLTFFPDRVLAASYQPATGAYLVIERDVGGSEFNQLYRFDPVTGEATLLTDGKSKNDVGPWSTGGTRIAYRSTRRNGTDTDIYIMDPANPSSDRKVLEVQGGGWAPLDWSPDDKSLLVSDYHSVNESALWLIDLATGSKRRLTPPGVVAYGGGQFSPDGKLVYATSDEGAEFARLIAIDVATGVAHVVSREPKWDVEDFALSHDGKTLAYVTNEDGISIVHLMDPKTGAIRHSANLPVGVIGGLRWHRNNRDLGFVVSSARSPQDVYSLNVETGNVDRWTESETGGIDPKTFVEPKLVHWKGTDGLTLSGFLYQPATKFTGKRPVIIDIHGGPEGQSRPGFLGRLNYFIDQQGVAIIFPNVRGSTGYGKTFVAADNGVKRVDAYHDIGTLFDWIATQPDLDASRVMVTGGSYGGHMTLVTATLYADKITCALDVVGMSNLATFLEHTESYRRDLRRVEYGDERDSTVRAFMEAMAPLNHADKITKPLFVVSGANDPRVPKSEADQIVGAVRQHGTPVWYLVGLDEGHGFAKKKNQDYQQYATVAFVQQYLLGGVQ